MSNVPLAPGRIVGLTITVIISSLFGLMAALGAVRITTYFTDFWNGTAGLVTPRIPFAESWADVDKLQGAEYAGVALSSPDPLVVPRILQAVDAGLTSLVGIAAALLVAFLAGRLLARADIRRLARWGSAALGILIMLKAAVGPQLQQLSVDLAVVELGYPTGTGAGEMNENSPELVTLGLWDPVWTLARVDDMMFLFGAIIALFGFLLVDRIRAVPATVQAPPSVVQS